MTSAEPGCRLSRGCAGWIGSVLSLFGELEWWKMKHQTESSC